MLDWGSREELLVTTPFAPTLFLEFPSRAILGLANPNAC
jgi:hypothetical protein